MRPPVQFIASLCFLLWLTASTPAQYRFDSWTTDNGLPQNGVRGIVQTPDGYLWFTTFDGLVRFDGATFTVFDKNNSKGIASNRFFDLHLEADGTLIAAAEDGIITFYRDGKFSSLLLAGVLPGGAIMGFVSDVHGVFYVATTVGKFYLRDEQFYPVPEANTPNEGHYYLGPSGSVWLYDPHGVRHTSAGHETVYPITFDTDPLMKGMKLLEDSRGNLWVGDMSSVYRLKDGQVTKFAAAEGVPANTQLAPWLEDNDGSIWFATGGPSGIGAGVARYKDGRFEAWGRAVGLASDLVSRLFRDREGNIWVVPLDHGLCRLQRQLIKSLSAADGLIYTEVYPLMQTRSGVTYVGTTRGLSRLTASGRFVDVLVTNPEGVRVSITALWEDERGVVWVGSVNGDLFLLENGTSRRIKIGDKASVFTIQNDRAGNVWVGTDKGLLRFRNEQIVERLTTQNGLPSNDIKIIHLARDGALWLGTYGGLVRMESGVQESGGGGEQGTLPHSPSLFPPFSLSVLTTRDGLASDRIRAIHEDRYGVFWIGTYDGGLSRFRDGKFFNYTIDNGLFNNGVFEILEDDRHTFWISSNRGIYSVNRSELEEAAAGRLAKVNSIAYGKRDGMLNTECNGGRQPAGFRALDGKLWFPTQDGVVIISADEARPNQEPPPVQIESILIDHQPVGLRDEIRLRANSDNLELRYTGISFIKPEQVKFRYRLEGLNDSWNDLGTRREVYFASLPAGEYTFRVIAANADGVWNQQGALLKIHVQAPFWKQTWFIASCALLGVAGAFVAFRLRERELKRRQVVQQEYSRRLLESQEDERKRIASEMHDSLGQYLLAIKNWALFGLNSLKGENPAREHLSEISDTSTLALEEVREIAHNLRPYQLERLGLTNTLDYMLKHLKNASAIKLTTQLENIDGRLSPEAEISFYRIAQECVNNVIKHSRAANMWLSVKTSGDGVDLVCRDDGQGYDVEAVRNSSKSGLGLNGIAERVRILGGSQSIESAPGQGTTVHVRINGRREA